MPTSKVSVAIGDPELEWARARARAQGKSLSALLTETIAEQKRLEAMRNVLDWLGEGKPPLTRAEIDAAAEELGITRSSPKPKRRAPKTSSARRR